MAIDTRQKRRSVINCRNPWGRTLVPVPDGAIGQSDRQFIPGRYSGILWVQPYGIEELIIDSTFSPTLEIDSTFSPTLEIGSIFYE